jgi:uncharacterized protein YutE (UPF0331/DUF86 family)
MSGRVEERLKRILDEVLAALSDLKKAVEVPIETYLPDFLRRRTARDCIIEIVEGLIDTGICILMNTYGENVHGYVEVFTKLVEKGIIDYEIGDKLKTLTRLRKIIVHRYWEVDDERIYREAHGNNIETVENIVKQLRRFIEGEYR